MCANGPESVIELEKMGLPFFALITAVFTNVRLYNLRILVVSKRLVQQLQPDRTGSRTVTHAVPAKHQA